MEGLGCTFCAQKWLEFDGIAANQKVAWAEAANQCVPRRSERIGPSGFGWRN